MEQLINNMLANAQLPQIPQAGKKNETENTQKDGFQKLLEQKQGTDAESAPKTEKPDAAQKPQDSKAGQSTEKTQEAEQPQQAGTVKKTDKELEEQMVLAAMAMMQTTVVPVEQAEEVSQTVVEAITEIVAEDAAPLMEEAVLTPEEHTFAPEAETAALETAVEDGGDQSVDQALREELPQTIEAPEAARESEGRTVEIKVENGHAEAREAEASEAGETSEEPQDGEVETAVFEDVKAVPVKVGEAPKPQAAEKPVEEQITPKVAQALQNGETRVEIQLTPENLGKITIEMTHSSDGNLVVQIHAENRETQNLLSKNSTHLAELLGRETEQEVRVEVPRQEESQRQDLYEQQQEQQRRHQQEQRRKHQASSEDFLQQLRLGLIPLDGE